MTTASVHVAALGPEFWSEATLGMGLGVPVAIGGDLSSAVLLAAHHHGVFCLPRSEADDLAEAEATYGPDVQAGDIPVIPSTVNPYGTQWWSPYLRYVIPTDEIRLGRTVRKKIRGSSWTTRVDEDFTGVLQACRGDRKPRWITEALMECLQDLHRDGWVKSIEVWEDDELVGGLFGFALDQVFVMSSTFSHRPHAAKVAIADLARRTRPGNIRLLDAQGHNDYTVSVGARGIPRAEYLQRLGPAGPPGVLDGHPADAERILLP
ncbi:leucyl/phenylalanyl-tRNA--protein transferase [Streptomyces sp. NPDC057697]|uniref:leucyl/phenylalanyl-tRNA--protein transferase n=1 Tax=Streptomyces sp. NPDC057697 TaxID=3346219 RepID=UPI0036CA92AD